MAKLSRIGNIWDSNKPKVMEHNQDMDSNLSILSNQVMVNRHMANSQVVNWVTTFKIQDISNQHMAKNHLKQLMVRINTLELNKTLIHKLDIQVSQVSLNISRILNILLTLTKRDIDYKS